MACCSVLGRPGRYFPVSLYKGASGFGEYRCGTKGFPALQGQQSSSCLTEHFGFLVFTFHRKTDLCEIKQPSAFTNLQQDCKHLQTSSYWQADLVLLLQGTWHGQQVNWGFCSSLTTDPAS